MSLRSCCVLCLFACSREIADGTACGDGLQIVLMCRAEVCGTEVVQQGAWARVEIGRREHKGGADLQAPLLGPQLAPDQSGGRDGEVRMQILRTLVATIMCLVEVSLREKVGRLS